MKRAVGLWRAWLWLRISNLFGAAGWAFCRLQKAAIDRAESAVASVRQGTQGKQGT